MDAKQKQNQEVKQDTSETSATYVRLAETLLNAIPNDRKEQWAGKVMAYIASETLHAASEGHEPPRIPTKAIHLDLEANPKVEPSAWLSPIWKEIESRHYPEIEPSLIDLCREAGLSGYPALQKDEGKPAYYRLVAKPLPPLDSSEQGALPEPPSGAITYKRDLSLQLSRRGKLFFSRGLQWTPVRRYSFITWQLFFVVSTTALLCLLWLGLWARKEPLTANDLVLFAIGLGFPWLAFNHLKGAFRLFDDRIMLAPDWMLAWKEFGATIEINRAKDAGTPSTLSVHRYSATCPTCGWMVKLDNGDPEFPRRIVGRCEENPREHVFSFDRSTKQGVPLHKA